MSYFSYSTYTKNKINNIQNNIDDLSNNISSIQFLDTLYIDNCYNIVNNVLNNTYNKIYNIQEKNTNEIIYPIKNNYNYIKNGGFEINNLLSDDITYIRVNDISINDWIFEKTDSSISDNSYSKLLQTNNIYNIASDISNIINIESDFIIILSNGSMKQNINSLKTYKVYSLKFKYQKLNNNSNGVFKVKINDNLITNIDISNIDQNIDENNNIYFHTFEYYFITYINDVNINFICEKYLDDIENNKLLITDITIYEKENMYILDNYNYIKNGGFENFIGTISNNFININNITINDWLFNSIRGELSSFFINNTNRVYDNTNNGYYALSNYLVNNIDNSYAIFLRDLKIKQDIFLNINYYYKLSFKYQKRNNNSWGKFSVKINDNTIFNINMRDIILNIDNNNINFHTFESIFKPTSSNNNIEFISEIEDDINTSIGRFNSTPDAVYITDIKLNKYKINYEYGSGNNIIQNGDFNDFNDFDFTTSTDKFYRFIYPNDTTIQHWEFVKINSADNGRLSLFGSNNYPSTLLEQDKLIDFSSNYYIFLRNTLMKQDISNLDINKNYTLSFRYQKRSSASLEGTFKVDISDNISNNVVLDINMNDIIFNTDGNLIKTYIFEYYFIPISENISLKFLSEANLINDPNDAIIISDITLKENIYNLPEIITLNNNKNSSYVKNVILDIEYNIGNNEYNMRIPSKYKIINFKAIYNSNNNNYGNGKYYYIKYNNNDNYISLMRTNIESEENWKCELFFI